MPIQTILKCYIKKKNLFSIKVPEEIKLSELCVHVCEASLAELSIF